MYYLYKRSKSTELPKFDYSFNKFDDFYAVTKLLEVPLIGTYHIRVKSDVYKDIVNFMNVSGQYSTMFIYIEVGEALLDYVILHKPDVSLLESKSNFELFKELVTKYNILFDKNCVKTMYYAIGHSYAEMDEALQLLSTTFKDVKVITLNEISKLFVVDNIVYPRSVCIMFLMQYRGRYGNLNKCMTTFGNDMVLYSIRKSARNFLDEKTKYLKTGYGSKLIQMMPYMNIIKLLNCIDYSRGKFMDVRSILSMYEKGVTVNDTLQKRTLSLADEEYYSLR